MIFLIDGSSNIKILRGLTLIYLQDHLFQTINLIAGRNERICEAFPLQR